MPREGGASSTPRAPSLASNFTEYWIVRRSLSSGAHSRDPLADDDLRVGVIARLDRAIQYSETSTMGQRSFYVYILASKIGGTLYIGVTNDLIRRVAEHRLKLVESFTEKYDITRLVYFEIFDDPKMPSGARSG